LYKAYTLFFLLFCMIPCLASSFGYSLQNYGSAFANRQTGTLADCLFTKNLPLLCREYLFMPSFALLQQFRQMGRKYPDGLAENRQTKGSKTNEIMATINENLKKQLAKKMYHFVKYFPVRIKNVGEDAIENRKLVWGFKDADREITLKVAQMTASYLLNEFGDRLKNIVFVCIPASTCEQNENRYRFFCEQVCSLAGVMNGFSHIRILADRPSVHENRKKNTHADFSERLMKFDEDFFKEKDVLIYDDVVTTGMSYAELAERLEFLGANVLGGLFLSRTYYKYQ